ncbi:MAG: metallophosphoesterase [Bacilli bacterium]|nr:metallophosphoesterase [Bacilli bacterium]
MKKVLYIILFSLLLFLSILMYAYFIGPKGLSTNEISYYSKDIDSSYNGLKVVHFSDLHYKDEKDKIKINLLINEIKKIKPDIVLFTGDLVDNNYEGNNDDVMFLIKSLSDIKSTYGNFSIIGDCDYSKIDVIKNIYLQSNFTILDNNYSIIYNEDNKQIFLGGVSSYNYSEASIDKVMNYFSNNEDIKFKIIMIHEGDYAKEILSKYDNISLILGGHSINGSINIPIIKKALLPKNSYYYYKPHYKVNNTDIFISNGIGFNDYNLRLFNHPTLNFYRIKSKD